MPRFESMIAIAGAVIPAVAMASSPLPRSTPEEQGLSSAAVLEFVQTVDRNVEVVHSVMIVRHGHVVAEGWWTPYDAKSPHMLFSLSKSFTSTAVGLAVEEGKLSIDDPVVKFFPDQLPEKLSGNLKAMRVRDLLTMSTGHVQAALDMYGSSPWDAPGDLVKMFLAMPVDHKPGTYWLYNSPATFLQSAIAQKVTGEKVADYLKPRLFDPLGIENPKWREVSSPPVNMGASGLNLCTEDVAKFGQLYLQKGKWNGKQLVPAAWIEKATTKEMSNGSAPNNDWDAGYGFQFWMCQHGAYRGDGAFGQLCIVMPQQDTLVVFTSGCANGTDGTAKLMNAIWDKLLPAMSDQPLTADEAGLAKLKAKLASLTLKPVEGQPTSSTAAKVSGRKYVLQTNDLHLALLSLTAGEKEDTLVLHDGSAQYRFQCGHGTWTKGTTTLSRGVLAIPVLEKTDQPVAASGAWTADDTYVAKLSFTGTPLMMTVTLKFEDDRVTDDVSFNVGFGATTRPVMTGKALE